MSKLQHQHYIPKSYLKNFAQEQSGKYFVEAKLKSEPFVKERLISIRDICVDKNLYTLPNDAEGDRFALEKYYATEIDNVYPEVYKWLTDERTNTIDNDQRRRIILTTMSLFFRTPKFLHLHNRRSDQMLKIAIARFKDANGRVKVNLNGYKLDFHINDIEVVRAELRIANKLTFLKQHMEDLHQFVNFKMKAGLSVITITGNIELIASDNPVEMHSVQGQPFDPFDPTNIIQLPLDNRHYLIIYPNTENAVQDMLFRGQRDFMFALTTNHSTEMNAQDWIMGKPGTIHAHLADQKNYNEETPENLERLRQMAEKARDARKLSSLIDTYGIIHPETISHIKAMCENPLHQHDTDLHETYLDLKQRGYCI